MHFFQDLFLKQRRQSAVEKEAYAIAESIQAWKQYLQGHYFKLITNQCSVAFMCNSYSSKIQNDKIMRWRVELSSCNYIVYRPGKDNKGAETFSRIQCSAISSNALKELHNSLCHPGITRMSHFEIYHSQQMISRKQLHTVKFVLNQNHNFIKFKVN